MRVALGVAYNGQRYSGWQSQLSGNTIQDHLEAALGRFAAQEVHTLCAGRTDADRKSTRLNSSHLVISYAVFCLKKKKPKKSPVPYHSRALTQISEAILYHCYQSLRSI